LQGDTDGTQFAAKAPAACPQSGKLTEFCFVQSQGGEIAAAAEPSNLKATPEIYGSQR
jgi:hypothetical protein